MDHQLRIYTLHAERLEDFLTLWREHVVPARAACGFEVVSSFLNRERREFCWIVRHTGEGDFAAGDARYYDSPERAALPWDPREAIAEIELRMLEPYSP